MFTRTLLAILLSLVASTAAAQTLRYFSWNPELAEIEAPLIAAFEEEHGVTVEVEALPPDQYWPRMRALAAAGRLPDVFYMSSGFIAEWQSEGLLADLTPFVADLDLSDYYSGVLSVAEFPQGGNVYAFPVNWVGTVLYYNADAFDAAGVAYPNDDWTWDDFLTAADALTIDENGDGTIDQWGYWAYGRYAHIEPWIFNNGGDLLNEARTRLDVNDGAREALTFLTDLVHEHGVAPTPASLEGIRQQDVFPQGIAAMWVDGTWNIANNRTIVDGAFAWDIAQVPNGPSSTGDVGYTWPDMMAMSPNGDQQDLAFDFIRHMTGEERSTDLYLGGTVPFLRTTAQSDAWLELDQQPANKDVILDIGSLPGKTSFTPNWGEWRGYAAAEEGGMNGELDAAFNGSKTIDEAIERFTEYGNGVLERVYPNP
ncbi:MAG: sugar ABC transporter substrate-binding protein [Trueperaceae bacterium]|nr:sugar ABC transporter substrate-binding protein [Trueperaceae bacterium]